MTYRNVPEGEKHYMAKLSKEEVVEIKEMLKTHGIMTLSRLFNISDSTIADIKAGRTWRSV